MSTTIKNIFNFSRSFPAPFDTMVGKKVSVSSKYGDGTEATLCTTVIKAVHAVCHCMDGTGKGAVGETENRMVAEYKSSENKDMYHIVVYNRDNGSIIASVFNKNTEVFENYVLNQANRDGAAVMMAVFPELMKDEEFKYHFEQYYEAYKNGYPNFEDAKKDMAMLCDNVYRRVKDDTCVAHVKMDVDKSGNLIRVSQTQIDSEQFKPKNVIAGEFEIFAKTDRVTVHSMVDIVAHTDFVGKYELSKRVLNAEEKILVPTLKEWYVIPTEAVKICKHAQATSEKSMPMRNFLLRGPAGTGKTETAKAIAAGLGLPYMKYTCSANTEVYDFIGSIFPDSEESSTGDEVLDAQRKALKAMGGINYENVAKIMNLPDLDDMDYDPAGVYLSLTGIENAKASTQECMAIVLNRVTDKIAQLTKKSESSSGAGQTYHYTETDFLKALKHGYVVEIQEPTTIMQPGVLVGLNSLLEQEGSITLPTGEVIQRHPDAVVIVTTNVSYEGCRGINQSVLDRMDLVLDVDMPSPDVMTQRAMSMTGATDEYQISQMVKVVNDLADYCQKNGITDGSYGMRSLKDWIISTEITGDVYSSALDTIISKATTNEEDRETLISTVLEPIFAPRRHRASA